jgi:hypothetical protein
MIEVQRLIAPRPAARRKCLIINEIKIIKISLAMSLKYRYSKYSTYYYNDRYTIQS